MKEVEVKEVDRRRGTATIIAGDFSLTFCLIKGKATVIAKVNLLKDRLYAAGDLWVPPNLLKEATRRAMAILFENERKRKARSKQIDLFRH